MGKRVGRCLVACRVEVIAVAGLLWIPWCVFGAARLFFKFVHLEQSASTLGGGNDSQPICLPRTRRSPLGSPLRCSLLRIMPSDDQYEQLPSPTSSSPAQASLIFDHTKPTSTTFLAPVAITRETDNSGTRTREGYRGMCSDPLDPGGEVHGCSVGCTLGSSDVLPLVFIVAARANP